MSDVIEYLLANPLFLAPILLLVAMMVYALIKKLLKMAAIVGDRRGALRPDGRVLRRRAHLIATPWQLRRAVAA